MQSTRRMYVDALLGEQPPNDVLQEALPNVIAAHTVQSYLGGYGSMVHPVAACATAAVSVEEGVDKIRLDKASVVVTGGFELALNCDFLVASEHAKFGDTHTRVGVMPRWRRASLTPYWKLSRFQSV